MKKTVCRLLLACALSAASLPSAHAADLEDWLVTTTMTGGPGPMGGSPSRKPQHLCQLPAGEHEMLDPNAVPPYCTMSKPTRAGETYSRQISCDMSAMMRDRLKGQPGASSIPQMPKMTGTVVSRRMDANTIDQTITYRMPQSPAVTLHVVGKRVGSCKKATFSARR